MNNDIDMDYYFLIKQDTWTFGDLIHDYVCQTISTTCTVICPSKFLCLLPSHNLIELVVSLLFV
jgi:hypothetical protein